MEQMKTVKVDTKIHEKMKTACIKTKETMSEFADAAILMRLDFLKAAEKSKSTKK
jgi:hypothetical protein